MRMSTGPETAMRISERLSTLAIKKPKTPLGTIMPPTNAPATYPIPPITLNATTFSDCPMLYCWYTTT